MSVKRWKGAQSSAWSTLNSGGNYNWLAGDGSNATEIPRGAGSPVVITAASYDFGTSTITFTAPGHGMVATDSIRFAGFVSPWSVLNWATPSNLTDFKVATVAGDDFTVANYTSIPLTAPTGSLDAATVQFMGDDVQMLSGDKGTNFCALGPTVAVTVNSLDVTVAKNATPAIGILGSNGQNLSIASMLSYVEAQADSTVTGGFIFGNTGARMILLAGCVGTIQAQPRSFAIGTYASFSIDVSYGASLVIRSTDALAASGTDAQVIYGGIIAGTLTLSSLSANGRISTRGGGATQSALNGAGAVLNINTVAGTAHLIALGAGTLNISSSVAFAPSGNAGQGLEGATINVLPGGSLVLYSAVSGSIVHANTTINAYGPVALANFDCGTRTLTVNSFGYPVTVVDVTGTLVVTGATTNSGLWGMSGTMAE